MIKTVIFDIGNVLMRFSWWDYILQHMDYDTAELVSDAIWRRGLWNELDRGVLSVEAVFEAMIAVHPEEREAILTALDRISGACHRQPYAIEWIRSLKTQGYQVLFLSNYSDWLREKAPEVLDFLPHMDGGVFSSHVKHIKPDPEIYRIICEKYSLLPEECLFIDDNADNVASANRFGIRAVRFTEYAQSYPVIMQLLAESGLPCAE